MINYMNLTDLDYLKPSHNEPPMANHTIYEIISDFQRETNIAEWDERRTSWYIRRGTLQVT